MNIENGIIARDDGAADALRDMGYPRVSDYRGGKEYWREGGLPLESGVDRAVPAS